MSDVAVTLLPDTEALVAAFLRQHDAITAIGGAGVFGGTLPPDREPPWPAGRVSAAPGGVAVTSRPIWVAKSLLYVDGWGTTRDDAYDFTAAMFGAMEQLPGEHALGVVTGVTFTLLPSWDPDETVGDPAQPRWRFASYVTAHPLIVGT